MMSGKSSWVIFDADNTLWDVEPLYDEARRSLCELLRQKGCDVRVVEAFQRQRDVELYATYGYSACRFARSFEDSLLHFLPNSEASDVRHVRRMALEVFERQAVPTDGLEELLDTLAEAKFAVGIITAGVRWVQERRLADFHLRHKFAAVDILESKTANAFRLFCERHQVDVATSWVVGDSIRSDILPARAAGLQSVWLNVQNWTPVEIADSVLEADTPQIHQLSDLPKVLGLRS